MPPVISTSGGAHGARSPSTTPVCETVFDANRSGYAAGPGVLRHTCGPSG
jgi:hypothetical protein